MKNCPYCDKPMEEDTAVCLLCNNIAPAPVSDKKRTPIFLLRELLVLLGAWIFLGIAHNYLLYGKADGISVPLFALLFVSFLFGVAHILRVGIRRNALIMGAIVLVFSLFQAIRVGDVLTSFNTGAIYFSSFLLLSIVVKGRFEDMRMGDYFKGPARIFRGSLEGIGIWIRDFVGLGIRFGDSAKYIHILKGILMAIPLVFVFSMLFASADIVFRTFLDHLVSFEIFDLAHVGERCFNIAIFSFVFLGVFAYVAHAARSFKKEDETEVATDGTRHIEIYIMLSFVFLLFLAFVVVQMGYLFGDEQMILSMGHTYAEYATKGFHELFIIALIVFILFWKIDHYLYAHTKPSDSPVYKGLSSLIISLTILILFSAFHRLSLYETTYGYTEVRFYGYVCIVVLGLSLFFTLYKILAFVKEGHFLIGIVSLWGVALLVCNVINPESFIAESNSAKTYRGSLRMDSAYIGGRSEDAVDNMIRTYDALPPEEKKDMEFQFCSMIKRLKTEYSWQEFNYSRYHARKILFPREKDFSCVSNDQVDISR